MDLIKAVIRPNMYSYLVHIVLAESVNLHLAQRLQPKRHMGSIKRMDEQRHNLRLLPSLAESSKLSASHNPESRHWRLDWAGGYSCGGSFLLEWGDPHTAGSTIPWAAGPGLFQSIESKHLLTQGPLL